MNDRCFHVAVDLAMELGEGPAWDAARGRLYWVDIKGFALHWLDVADNHHGRADFDEAISCVAVDDNGRLIAACRSGLWQLGADSHKQRQIVAAPYDTGHHRFNDGGCDHAGRFWIGAMNERVDAADAALYRLDGDALTPVLGHMTITNGFAISPDGAWLYHTDTPTRVIRRHALDGATGDIGPGEPWIDLADHDLKGNPDGAAVDQQGHYWTALFGGAAVARFDADGRLVARYPLAALNPTMPCFGGPDRCTLYVTTAREGMSEHDLAAWPDSGSVLAMTVDTPGQPIAAFRGVPEDNRP